MVQLKTPSNFFFSMMMIQKLSTARQEKSVE